MRRGKRIAVQVHLWLGLIVGLLWSLQGLTGATLVFHRELDRIAHAEWRGTPGPPLPADRLIALAEQQTGQPVTALGILDSGRDLRTATYKDASGTQRMLLMDAATGRVVGERLPQPGKPEDGSTSRFIYMLHEKLVSGETGETIIGTSGILLLSSSLLGLWIAWPRPGNWRALFSPRGWKTLQQKFYSWHRVAGLVFGLLYVLIAMGGVYMIFTESIRHGLGKVITLQQPYKAPADAPAAGAAVPAQQALASAEKLFPNAEFVRLAMPAPDKPFYVIRLRQPGEVRAWSGATSITVDAASGRVVQVQDALAKPPADRLADAQYSIHNGEILGLFGRLMIMLAGLSLPTFYITGVWLWFRKRRLTRQRQAPAISARAQPLAS
ncbi:MAG TPA: PepSY-associated TM helix domain-containing protein [Sphingomicrobium sp.]|jgi:uncharacterized iron-regulated membrane protein